MPSYSEFLLFLVAAVQFNSVQMCEMYSKFKCIFFLRSLYPKFSSKVKVQFKGKFIRTVVNTVPWKLTVRAASTQVFVTLQGQTIEEWPFCGQKHKLCLVYRTLHTTIIHSILRRLATPHIRVKPHFQFISVRHAYIYICIYIDIDILGIYLLSSIIIFKIRHTSTV